MAMGSLEDGVQMKLFVIFELMAQQATVSQRVHHSVVYLLHTSDGLLDCRDKATTASSG